MARFPRGKRIHGVEGIRAAHQAAARVSETEFFFVVDGDNKIISDFSFALPDFELRADTLYVWRCLNPANGLIYGYGAVKLYNKALLAQREQNPFVDLASSIAERYQIVPILASETHFFSTPQEAWQGAFRECTKLASEMIRNQNSLETRARLRTWCEQIYDVPNAQWVLAGARMGRDFALQTLRQVPNQLQLINDFDWLAEKFREVQV